MFVITAERPKVLGRVSGGVVELDKRPVAYGLYRGRPAIEVDGGIYVLDGCRRQVVVKADGHTYVLDFAPFLKLCGGPPPEELQKGASALS